MPEETGVALLTAIRSESGCPIGPAVPTVNANASGPLARFLLSAQTQGMRGPFLWRLEDSTRQSRVITEPVIMAFHASLEDDEWEELPVAPDTLRAGLSREDVAKEVAQFVTDHPGKTTYEIAVALHLPRRIVKDVAEGLASRKVLRKGSPSR